MSNIRVVSAGSTSSTVAVVTTACSVSVPVIVLYSCGGDVELAPAPFRIDRAPTASSALLGDTITDVSSPAAVTVCGDDPDDDAADDAGENTRGINCISACELLR